MAEEGTEAEVKRVLLVYIKRLGFILKGKGNHWRDRSMSSNVFEVWGMDLGSGMI